MLELIAARDTREHLERGFRAKGYDALNEIENPLLQLCVLAPQALLESGHEADKQVKARILRVIARGSAQARKGQPFLSSRPAVELMRELASRQDRLCCDLPGTPVRLTLETMSAMTCGMGLPTIFENGLTLLRPYGLPVVQESAIKGTMASWLAEMLAGRLNLRYEEERRELSNAGLLELFGSAANADDDKRGSRGTITFLDALPLKASFEPDVTTVHHAEWYSGGLPAGFENPTPIPFLTVARGSVFQFRLMLQPEGTLPSTWSDAHRETLKAFGIMALTSLEEFVRELVESTAWYKGFGAQTAVGYGRLKPVQAARADA